MDFKSDNISKLKAHEAIETIMDLYGDDVKKFVYMYLKNEEDANDVTQEVFLTVYFKISTFKGNSTLKSWIYSIAANKCKDHLKSYSLRYSKLIKKISLQQQTVELYKGDLSDECVHDVDRNALFDGVMELPVKYREVIILYYYKDLSIKEISLILNLKESTLQSRLLRARKKLQKLISEGGIILG